jgi:hypothetical protein
MIWLPDHLYGVRFADMNLRPGFPVAWRRRALTQRSLFDPSPATALTQE